MTVNNSYNVLNSGYEKLRSMYNLNEENDLSKTLHEALKNNENVTLMEDKVSISKQADESQFGSDAWLDKVLEDLKKQEEQNEITGIINKLYMGQELSAGEMEILREKAPELYKMACEAKQMAKNLEEQLKNCKSKEEVDRLKMNTLQGVAYRCGAKSASSEIPEDQQTRATILFGTVNRVFSEFCETEDYAKLPKENKEEHREKEEKQEQGINLYI